MGKPRSRNYPAISLGDALDRTHLVYRQEGRAAVPADVLVKAWGYNSLNGASLRVLSALRQYGLIEGGNDQVRLSEQALALLLEEEGHADYVDALNSTLESPTLFREIMEEWGRDDLPSDAALLSWLVRKQNFTDAAARTLVQAFRDSLEFVKAKGALYISNFGPDVELRNGSDQVRSKPIIDKSLPRTGDALSMEYTWALSGNIVASLRISGGIPEIQDVELLSQFLDLAKKAIERTAQSGSVVAARNQEGVSA